MCFVEAHDLTKTRNVKVNEEFFLKIANKFHTLKSLK